MVSLLVLHSSVPHELYGTSFCVHFYLLRFDIRASNDPYLNTRGGREL